MENIFGKNLAELTELVLGLGLPKFRGIGVISSSTKSSYKAILQLPSIPSQQ